jgi:hypothetical protein
VKHHHKNQEQHSICTARATTQIRVVSEQSAIIVHIRVAVNSQAGGGNVRHGLLVGEARVERHEEKRGNDRQDQDVDEDVTK